MSYEEAEEWAEFERTLSALIRGYIDETPVGSDGDAAPAGTETSA